MNQADRPLRDPDMVAAEVAMKRAALKAREMAQKAGTAIVTIKDNKIIEDYPGRAYTGE